jgi:catechol 2,3-dioxygenase-like lactoylglutathione lyase family enzyme
MAKVTGIGGVFFRVADQAATVAWYRDHLGIEPEAEYPCATLRWSGGETTVWAPFAEDTEYFGDRRQHLMVNYRVDDVDQMLEQLRARDVEIVGDPGDADNGRFAWAVDGDGHRFELWQPAPAH